MDITKLVCPDAHPQAASPIPAMFSYHVGGDPTLSSSSSLHSLPPIPSAQPVPALAPFLPAPPLPIQPPLSRLPVSAAVHHQYQLPVVLRASPPADPMRPPSAAHHRVECGLCGKSFSGISSHNRHVSRTHHKARPFACSQCGLQFGQKGSLDRHTAAVHLKARPYTCDHCGKGFGRKDNMKIHMTTVHLKKKPYKCDMCPKSFGGKRPLKIHRQTVHFKQRPLQCSFCDKRFGQRSNLNVHIKVHRRANPNSLPASPTSTAPVASHLHPLSPLPTSPIASSDDAASLRLDPGTPRSGSSASDVFSVSSPESTALVGSPI